MQPRAGSPRASSARGPRPVLLAFGSATPHCLGKILARAELPIAWPRLFERVPGLRLAVPEEELSFRNDSSVYGLRSLPVTW